MAKVESTISEIVTPIAEKHGYELVDVEYKKEGSNWYLRIFIDKEGGITIEDCENVSRELDETLDEKLIPEAYILEVSSPGLDRPLKKDADFEKYKGKIVDIKLYKSIDKQKEFQGELLGLENNIIKIMSETGNVLEFERENVAMVRLTVIF
jgi:ribosome maturation factor RimP